MMLFLILSVTGHSFVTWGSTVHTISHVDGLCAKLYVYFYLFFLFFLFLRKLNINANISRTDSRGSVHPSADIKSIHVLIYPCYFSSLWLSLNTCPSNGFVRTQKQALQIVKPFWPASAKTSVLHLRSNVILSIMYKL